MAATRSGRPTGTMSASSIGPMLRVFSMLALLTFFVLTGLAQTNAAGGGSSETALSIARDSETGNVHVIVGFKASVSDEERARLHGALGVRVRKHIRALHADVVALPPNANAQAALRAYRASNLVAYAEPDYVAAAFLAPNDPLFPNQWHLGRVHAPQAWDVCTGRASITVAVVDTGVALSHPDLAQRLVQGYDFVNNDADPSDDNGHGTLVAGVIGAVSNNGQGVAGLNWEVSILPVKVLGSDGRGAYSTIAQGITYAADRGARVINLSLGGTSDSYTLKAAVDYAASKGALVFAAAGNSAGAVAYPAAYESAVAISAIDQTDNLARFSNYGPEIDLTAPGVSVYTTTRSGYGSASGTSLSCPVAAGVAALLWGAHETWTASQVLAQLKATADDLGTTGPDPEFGYGCVNAHAALGSASGTPESPQSPPDTVPPALRFLSPQDGQTVSGVVDVSVDASDAGGVAYVEIYVDDALLAHDTQAPYGASWNSAHTQNGAHTILARAVDAAGNIAEEVISVTVENDTRTTTVFKGTVNSKTTKSIDHAVAVNGAGQLEATLSWPGKARLQLELFDTGGSLLASSAGASPVTLSACVSTPGTYVVRVTSLSGKASYTLHVVAP